MSCWMRRPTGCAAPSDTSARRLEKTPEPAATDLGRQGKAEGDEALTPDLRDGGSLNAYQHREAPMGEALIRMCLAGVSLLRAEDITEALKSLQVSTSSISELNKKVYEKIEEWRNRF